MHSSANATILLNLCEAEPDKLVVLDRLVDVQPLALAVAHGDDGFPPGGGHDNPSRLYRSGQILPIYEKYFGKATRQRVKQMFRILAVPE